MRKVIKKENPRTTKGNVNRKSHKIVREMQKKKEENEIE